DLARGFLDHIPAAAELAGLDAHRDVTVRQLRDAFHCVIDDGVAHGLSVGADGDPNRAAPLRRLGNDAAFLQTVEPARVIDFVLAPELAQELDAFGHAPDALAPARAERAQLGMVAAADADSEHRASLGELIEARPLNREQHRMAHREARHAHYAEADFRRPRRRGAQHHDRLDPGLVKKTVAEPDGFKDAAVFGERRRA